jgi:prepilin-type N-terminal cleavage/methylation domain-containing protein
MNQETGYTLIEIIASLVIVGIIATFSSLFLVVGIEGYEFTRKAADAAMKTEVALNRISLELRSISSITSAPVAPSTGTSITYNSSNDKLAGTRTIKFDSGSIYITVADTDVNGTYKLLDDVSSLLLSVTPANLDNVVGAPEEAAYIDVGFSLSGMPDFELRVYPRNMVSMP